MRDPNGLDCATKAAEEVMVRARHPSGWLVGAAAALLAFTAQASSLRVSPASSGRSAAEVEADYGTVHLFVDELAKDTIPVTVFFDAKANIAEADVHTNLNRRDLATVVPDAGGIEEGISSPSGNTIAAGDERHYFHAVTMQPVQGGFQVTLAASKTGAYRLTARYRLAGEAGGIWHWYNDEQSAPGVFKRDFAIVVSPAKARDIQLYEANPLTIAASGTAPEQRGTFAAMSGGAPGAGAGFSLDYLQRLGVNALWLQPIHPRGIVGRLTDPATGAPFALVGAGGGERGASGAAGQKQAVLTRSYDNARTGADINERVLSPGAIRGRGLVKAFSLVLAGDDQRIEAQPLYVPGVIMPDGKAHEVIYAFSMSNHVWAFDAENGAADFSPQDGGGPATLRLLWQQAGFSYSKFCPPVVADGELLVPTYDGRIDVYRLGPDRSAPAP